MTMKLSRIYGMDVYTDRGEFLGKAQDIVTDLEKGEVSRITLEPLESFSREDAKRILREKAVSYKYVKSVGDIIVVSRASTATELELPEEEPPKEQPRFGYGFRR